MGGVGGGGGEGRGLGELRGAKCCQEALREVENVRLLWSPGVT